MQVEEIPKSEAELEPIKHLRQSFFTKIDNGLKQKYKSHSPLPPFLLPTPPPILWHSLSIPWGSFYYDPPPLHFKIFFRNTHPRAYSIPRSPLQLITEE